MSNIVITEKCNLACPYCFANEFVNKNAVEISMENFVTALEFLLSSPHSRGFVGIIGGEPTLHSKYDQILTILNDRDDVQEVTLYTNGIRLDRHFDLISDKFGFLINLNSPTIIGKKNFLRIMENIKLVVSNYPARVITLGINLYQPNQDYTYFLEVIEKFKLPSARISITVPFIKVAGYDAIKRLDSFKELAYKLYVDLMYREIRVVFDCNKIPMCLWSDIEKQKITLFQANEVRKQLGINLTSSKCNPVIDILPDLTAIRCFGLSEISKVPISDFDNIDDLKNYYLNKFDKPFSKKTTYTDCTICKYYQAGTCYSGCLTNKLFE